MPEILQEAQKLEPSAIVSLFSLDTTKLDGPILYFVMSTKTNGNKLVFNGITYEPIDIEFRGLETTGVGSLPTPTLTLKNDNSIVQLLVNTYGDLNGCEVTRLRTYARFLDGEPEADPTAYFGPDRYRVERMVSDTPEQIEWELSASIDQEGKMLPGRVVIAGTCMWRYRVYNPTTGLFNYSKAQCPYTGAQGYDLNDLPVPASLDQPSRRLSCCKVRFGENNPLPFGGFPGAARVQG